MKRLVVFLAALVTGVTVLSIPIFATDQLTKDLYISEISINQDDRYVEIFLNKAVLLSEYYLISTTNTSNTPSKIFRLNDALNYLPGDYATFEVLVDDGLLNNPTNKRIVYICRNTQSTATCISSPTDTFEYSKLVDTNYSWSRDFSDENLAINLSQLTPGEQNDFDIDEDKGEEDDGDNGEVGNEPEKATQYCQALVLSEISSVDQWVELYNKSDLTIFPANISECLVGVQSGDTKSGNLRNYNYYKILSFLDFTSINKYAYTILDLTKTESKNKILPNSSSIKDRSVIIADDETDYDYGAIYKSQKEGTTLSYFSDGWKVTYLPTPGEENKYQQYQTCEAGKHINEATGNCVKDPEPPAECAEGQYRNPATGRCKKIAEVNTLAECPEGQYRNPLTNRCKKIATDDDLVPCAEGYERNPETNRCRKIRASEDAEYAVEPYGASNENHTWAVIGAIGIGAIGLLIILQFRHEIAHGFGKIVKRIKK